MIPYGFLCWIMLVTAVRLQVEDYCGRTFSGVELRECLSEMPVIRNREPMDWLVPLTAKGVTGCSDAPVFFYKKIPHVILK